LANEVTSLLPDSAPARAKSALHQTKATSSPHEADDDTGACQRRRLANLLLLCAYRCERTGIAHVVPGCRDPAVGPLDVRAMRNPSTWPLTRSATPLTRAQAFLDLEVLDSNQDSGSIT
jgi:hypothetical protein